MIVLLSAHMYMERWCTTGMNKLPNFCSRLTHFRGIQSITQLANGLYFRQHSSGLAALDLSCNLNIWYTLNDPCLSLCNSSLFNVLEDFYLSLVELRIDVLIFILVWPGFYALASFEGRSSFS